MDSAAYQPGYIDWQHQSPAPTSHSSDPYALGLTSPFKSDDSFTALNDQWMTPASTARTGLVPSSAIMSPLQNAFTPSAHDASRDMSLKRQRNGSHISYGHHHEGLRELQTPFADMATVQGPFVNNSFLERFDGTSLDESAFMPSNSTASATSYHHMHTPPPTRDATSQRRLHKPTPLQTRTLGEQDVRRMSAPSAPMQHSIENTRPSYEHAAMPPSQTNMLQWQTQGPAPAPMGANSNMFWDPHRAATSSFTMYSSISEDPFAPEPWSNPIVYDQSPVPTLSTPETFHPSVPVARLRAQSAARPRSAGPFSANNSAPRLRPMSFAAPANPSGVDPSLLMTGQGSMSQAIGNPFAASFPVDGRRPYQFQLEQMRKEKEDSARKAIRQPRPRPLATAFGSGLRRSMTDSRARRCNSPLRHHDPQPANVVTDSTDDLRNAHIPRDSSPLKRHRSDAHRPSLFSSHTQRQSVVLMVDEEGRARTEVRTLPASTDDDDDTVTLQHHDSLSPTRNFPLSRSQSLSQASETLFEASEDPSDARNALIADRQRRKKANDTIKDSFDSQSSDAHSSATEAACGPLALDLSYSDDSVGLLSAGSQPSTTSSTFSMSHGHADVYPFPSTSIQASPTGVCEFPKAYSPTEAQYAIQCSSCKNTFCTTGVQQASSFFICTFCMGTMNTRPTRSNTSYELPQNGDWQYA